jgi:hypothetical protein
MVRSDPASRIDRVARCPLKRKPSLLLDSKSAGRIGYKTQSKFVRCNHPFGDDARFRKGPPTLEDILRVLKERAGENTFTKLVGLGVIREEIGSLLQMIGVSSDDTIQWPREKRREAEQLSRSCLELAATIELARQKWPFGSRMMYSDYEEWNELPRVLRSYAEAWKKNSRVGIGQRVVRAMKISCASLST